MTATIEHDRPRGIRRRRPSVVCCLVLALAALTALPAVTALPGCGGCRQDSAKAKAAKAKAKKEAEEKKRKEELARKKKKKRKPDFDPITPASQPMAGRASGTWYKPSHWMSTTIAAKTNHFDFPGELQLEATDNKGKLVPVPSTRFTLATVRDAPLHKGKQKHFDSVVFTPSGGQSPRVAGRLSSRKSGRTYGFLSIPMRMPSYQYHLVVLSRQPNYSYLSTLASVKPSASSLGFSGPVSSYYRVVPITVDPQVKSRVELPSYSMLWTSVACVLWDEADPSKLNLPQQQAMLDWLHWGGQLILSGPGTLGTLRGSFLEDYLPATEAATRELTAVDFEPLLQWGSDTGNGRGKEPPELKLRRSVPAIELKMHRDARYLPGSGELIAERRVGRGRVVVTTFRLSDLQLTAWKGFDELVNAFLLRRPAREFLNPARGGDRDLHVRWVGDSYSPAEHLDAGIVSNVRYFTRDSGVSRSQYGADMVPRDDLYDYSQTPSGTGVAAWNDFNGVAGDARKTLREAARIEIPDRRFVFWVVVGYLAVLVPANWIVFRLLGRVEWCWVAAPVIAVICTIGVIRAAQLDIGFVRARTEIAVLEMQGGYDRGHATRYTVLYTSLAAPYSFQFDDAGSLALPFPRVDRPEEFFEHRKLTYRRDRGASLSDYYVDSNAIGMLHSEQMIELGGSLTARRTGDGGFEVINGTEYTLLDARVVRKNDQGSVETLWLGEIEPNQRKRPAPTAPGSLDFESAALDLDTLAGQALDSKTLQPKDVRLIACLKEELPGLTIEPSANQPRCATLVVAHLNYDPGPDPKPDANLRKEPPRPRDPGFGPIE